MAMVKVDLGGCSSFVNDAEYQQYVDKALDAFDVLECETGAGNDFLGWKHLPTTTPESLITECEAVRDLWRAKGVDLVVVIGIGGSYLGAKCAVEALSHSFARQLSARRMPEMVFAGHNLSEEYLAELLDLMQERNVAAVIISKSGTTTEPAVSFRPIKQLIETRYGSAEAAQRIVAVTDAHKGALKSLATQEGYKTFVIATNVGGRFSVLTPVGILPIVLAGFDIRAILKGAAEMEKVTAERSRTNPAVEYAAMRNLLYSKGKKIEILVSFNPKLQYLGEWWKQLTVVTVEKSSRSVVVASDPQNLDELNYLTGKHVEECNAMAELGTKLAHIDGGVPQLSVRVEKLDEYNLGSLFYFFEKSCGISAYILGVNPFNQPGVEAYKKNMFALLGKPGYEEQAKALHERLGK